MSMAELNNILVNYIENNKCKHDIDYKYSIDALFLLIQEIENGYKEEELI